MIRFVRFSSTTAQPSIASLVAKLRSQTGQSFSLCKEALQQAELDLSKASEILGKLVSAQADKTQNRAMENAPTQGMIGLRWFDKHVGLIKLKCQSDFVARSEPFLELGNSILNSLAGGQAANFIEKDGITEYLSRNLDITRLINEAVGKVKEPISLASLNVIVPESNETLGIYLHQRFAQSDFGLLAAVVGVASPAEHVNSPWLSQLSNQLAKHVAGLNPQCIKAFFDQAFLFNPGIKVADHFSEVICQNSGTQCSSDFKISRFHRLAL